MANLKQITSLKNEELTRRILCESHFTIRKKVTFDIS